MGYARPASTRPDSRTRNQRARLGLRRRRLDRARGILPDLGRLGLLAEPKSRGHHGILLPRRAPDARVGCRDLDCRDLALSRHLHRRAPGLVRQQPHLSYNQYRDDHRRHCHRVRVPPRLLSAQQRIDLRGPRDPLWIKRP